LEKCGVGLKTVKLFLLVSGDYFKRALQSACCTDQLAVGTPAAIIYIQYSYYLISHNKCSATADAYAKSAAITPGGIKDG
jgi:hypothetical protein